MGVTGLSHWLSYPDKDFLTSALSQAVPGILSVKQRMPIGKAE